MFHVHIVRGLQTPRRRGHIIPFSCLKLTIDTVAIFILNLNLGGRLHDLFSLESKPLVLYYVPVIIIMGGAAQVSDSRRDKWMWAGRLGIIY